MARIEIVVVNYNTRELLRACLETAIREIASRVMVIDNASSDGSVEMVKAEFPTVLLIENNTNIGYGAAANQAIALGSTEYILLLNSDTLLSPGTCTALCDHLEHHPRAAILGPHLVHPDGSTQGSCFPFPDLLHVFLDISNINHLIALVPFLRDRYTRTWAEDQSREVPWVLGAALAICRKAFEQVGGFDESFFMYYEEVDLCYRLAQKGWQTLFTPAAKIVHTGGATTRQKRIEMILQLYKSLAHFYRLHFSSFHLFLLVILIDIAALFRIIRDVLLLQVAHEADSQVLLKDQIAAWRNLLENQWYKEEYPTNSLHKTEKQFS